MFKDTRYFTVFGNAYVPENHGEGCGFTAPRTVRAHRPIATSWLVACTLVAGISAFAAQLAFTAGIHGLF